MVRRAFTLIELLVVIAIIAILAAILFPVFAQAKESAKKTSCLTQTKQVNLSMIGYSADFDDYLVPTNGCAWGSAVYGTLNCSTYPEMTQPYAKNWQIHRSPGDGSAENVYRTMPDDSGPCTSTDPGKCYGWRSNYGYNFLFLSPPVYDLTTSPIINGEMNPQSGTKAGDPARTIATVTSIWDRGADGRWKGGGNWAVNAPCIIGPNGQYAIPTSWSYYALSTRTWPLLWDYADNTSPTQFGYAMPFFTSRTVVNTSYLDGHTKGQKIGELVRGCNVNTMVITDVGQYQWDLN